LPSNFFAASVNIASRLEIFSCVGAKLVRTVADQAEIDDEIQYLVRALHV
jgi:hypothetical protein